MRICLTESEIEEALRAAKVHNSEEVLDLLKNQVLRWGGPHASEDVSVV
jgi:hypothetical protein